LVHQDLDSDFYSVSSHPHTFPQITGTGKSKF
jgi:hypothetical protein